MLLGITQGLLVAAGASADDIAYPREDVAEQVGADDGIAGDDAQVLDDPAAFDSIGGDDQHRCLLPAERQPAYTACTGARMLQAALQGFDTSSALRRRPDRAAAVFRRGRRAPPPEIGRASCRERGCTCV